MNTVYHVYFKAVKSEKASTELNQETCTVPAGETTSSDLQFHFRKISTFCAHVYTYFN